jgi:hypothetical protein
MERKREMVLCHLTSVVLVPVNQYVIFLYPVCAFLCVSKRRYMFAIVVLFTCPYLVFPILNFELNVKLK